MIGGYIGKPIGGTIDTPVEAVGAAAGIGGASGGGGQIAASTANGQGIGGTSAVSAATKASTGSGQGIGAATAISAQICTAAGDARGIGGASAVGREIIYLRPDADTATDGWTDELNGTTNIFQSIDEATLSDTDYVQSPSTAGSSADLIVRLFQGATEIAEWAHTDISATFTDATQTLTTPQFESITDWNDLFAELDDNLGNVYRFRISNPTSGVNTPVVVRYRYKRAA
jgi:hypothetical protein